MSLPTSSVSTASGTAPSQPVWRGHRPRAGWFRSGGESPLMVEQLTSITPLEVLDQFVSTSEAVLSVLAGLDEDGWCVAAESPAGHVPIRLVAPRAALGLLGARAGHRSATRHRHSDRAGRVEVVSAVCGGSESGLGHRFGAGVAGVYAVEATDPDIRFVLEVSNSVHVRDEPAPAIAPCLRGDAVTLIEALSLRRAHAILSSERVVRSPGRSGDRLRRRVTSRSR